MVEVPRRRSQIGREIDIKFLITKSRRRIELRQLVNAPCGKTYLLFELARGAHFGSFTVFNSARGDFQQLAPRRMPVLSDQGDASVVEQRQRAGPPGMTNDFANDLDPVLVEQTVTYNVEIGRASCREMGEVAER